MGKKGQYEGPKRLGVKLASIRRSLALSQSGMLRQLGISEEYTREEISAYERGVRTPPLHVLLKYSKVARVWVNVLIDDELDLPSHLPPERMHEGIPRTSPRKPRALSTPGLN
jgi:transcriptional regulator with XRE-family HTH domain